MSKEEKNVGNNAFNSLDNTGCVETNPNAVVNVEITLSSNTLPSGRCCQLEYWKKYI
jgi:hypothetical protein